MATPTNFYEKFAVKVANGPSWPENAPDRTDIHLDWTNPVIGVGLVNVEINRSIPVRFWQRVIGDRLNLVMLCHSLTGYPNWFGPAQTDLTTTFYSIFNEVDRWQWSKLELTVTHQLELHK